MDKNKSKILILFIIFYLLVYLLISQQYFLSILMLMVLIYETYYAYKQAMNGKEQLTVLKNLKSRRLSKSGQNILLPEASEITPLVYEINHLIDAYESLKIETEIQSKNSKQLLSNLSHDIRTPLTSIIGYVDALKDGVVSSEEEVKDFIDILAMKSKNLKDLTNQIFDVARIDADDVTMKFEHVNLNEFLIHMLMDFMTEIKKNEMVLENQLAEEPYMIYADRVALTRIFQNLIKNTIQHGKDGKVMGISSQKANNYYRVIIWDKGKGIPKSKQPLIFERLYKVDDARKLVSSNSGLGMSIAKKLVLKHKGNIFVKSEEHKFTEFYIEFPILKEMD